MYACSKCGCVLEIHVSYKHVSKEICTTAVCTDKKDTGYTVLVWSHKLSVRRH